MKACLSRWRCFGVIALVFLTAFFVTPPPSHADYESGILDGETNASNPKIRIHTVTATIADTTPPTVPILINPENNEILAVNIFPFIWQGSTDERGISKYELYLDGELLFDNILDIDNSTVDYDHTVDGNIHTLTFTTPIAEGLHTWKVMAYDGFVPIPNSVSSATWSFTIDTINPTILITDVGDEETSISSSDASTVPDDPIVLYENEPEIHGTTEAGATVTLTFTIPGDDDPTVMTTTASSTGAFSFTLPSLPRDKEIELDFVAQDAAGNIGIIENVPIIIKTRVVTLPPVIVDLIPPVIIGIIPPIPVIEPEEIKELIKEVVKERIILKILPEPLIQELGPYVDNVTPIANSLVGLIIPLMRLAIALYFTGVGIALFSIRLIRKGLRALYLLPPQERMGLVYDIETHKGVPYALVQIYPVKERDNARIEMPNEVREFVTDADGLYGPVSLPAGQYTLEISHRDYTYVAREEESRNSDNETLYKGEIFVSDENHRNLYFMVPMRNMKRHEENKAEQQYTFFDLLGDITNRASIKFSRLPGGLLVLATVVMAFIAFFYFTVWNVAMLVLYLYVLSKRSVRKLRLPGMVGGVVDQFGDPLSYALIRISPNERAQHVQGRHGLAVQADELGRFSFSIKPGFYTMQAVWFDGSSTDWMEIELRRGAEAVALSIHTGNELPESSVSNTYALPATTTPSMA